MTINLFRNLGATLAIVLLLAPIASVAQNAHSELNLTAAGVAAKGYDVVSYVDANKATPGSERFKTSYGGATYYFASAANRAKFSANPTAYIPQYGGWCAWAVAEKESKVDIDPTSFKVTDGKLFLFYKGVIGDVRPLWVKDEAALHQKAEANWPTVRSK